MQNVWREVEITSKDSIDLVTAVNVWASEGGRIEAD
jgi:hypothetical protein